MLDFSRHVGTSKNYIAHDIQKNLDFILHAHDTYEFIYVYEGSIDVTILDRIYRVFSGKCILIAPNEVHSYANLDYNKVYICNFSKEFINEFYLEYKNQIAMYPVFSIRNAEPFIKNLVAEHDKYALTSMFYQIISDFSSHTEFIDIDKKKNELLGNVSNYIINNLSGDVSLRKIANVFDYSYNYLSTVINNAFEKNYMDVVNSYRINRAIELVHNTDMPFVEIAKSVGYDSIRTFNRNYKKYKGITPTDTRENLKNGVIIDI